MTMLALIGKPLDTVAIEIPLADVNVGDEIVFGLPFAGVTDTDTVVKIDAKGVHFDCGSYLAAADAAVDAKVLIVK